MARIDLPQGTLDLLILKTVALEPQHGWEYRNASDRPPETLCRFTNGRSIHRFTDWSVGGGFVRNGVSLTTIAAQSTTSSLRQAGQRQLENESTSWRALSPAIESILDMA